MRKLTTEQFIQKAKTIHGDRYDYSLVEYKTAHIKVKIVCPIHGVFEQTPDGHISGHICYNCTSNNKIVTTKDFISKASLLHKNKYDYSLVNYITNQTNVKIICKEHGVFEQRPNNHIEGKQGCPKCKSSKGEMIIEQWLRENNIQFINQFRFEDCKNKRPLPFDFYLPKYNMCIEYDGEQHFKTYLRRKSLKYIKLLRQTQLNDITKNRYCSKNNIYLIRIPYTKFNQIEEILKSTI